jgi:hypothetical protein
LKFRTHDRVDRHDQKFRTARAGPEKGMAFCQCVCSPFCKSKHSDHNSFPAALSYHLDRIIFFRAMTDNNDDLEKYAECAQRIKATHDNKVIMISDEYLAVGVQTGEITFERFKNISMLSETAYRRVASAPPGFGARDSHQGSDHRKSSAKDGANIPANFATACEAMVGATKACLESLERLADKNISPVERLADKNIAALDKIHERQLTFLAKGFKESLAE